MVCPRRSWALWSLDGIEHLFDTGKPRFERIATERIAAGMKFARTYSTTGDPYAGIAFEPRTSRIVNPDGKVVFELKDAQIPTGWSQVATDIIAQKYFRKAGVPDATVRVPEEGIPEWLWRSEAASDAKFGPETDARQVFHRLAGCWAYWGYKNGYFDDEFQARAY
jgi:ribonucleoside-diphosphate reductase alpha chain